MNTPCGRTARSSAGRAGPGVTSASREPAKTRQLPPFKMDIQRGKTRSPTAPTRETRKTRNLGHSNTHQGMQFPHTSDSWCRYRQTRHVRRGEFAGGSLRTGDGGALSASAACCAAAGPQRRCSRNVTSLRHEGSGRAGSTRRRQCLRHQGSGRAGSTR